MRKVEFIQDAIALSAKRKPAYWGAQYDAIALGYQGQEIALVANILTEEAILESPAETIKTILKRIEDEK